MIVATILIIIAVIVGFLIYGGQALLGLNAADTNNIISLLPSVFVILVAGYSVGNSRGYFRAASVAGLGLAVAFAVYSLDNVNILIPELAMTANDIEVFAIFFFLAVGVLILAIKERR